MEFLDNNRELFAAIVGGIIATLGTVATMITSHYLRQAGRITVNISSSEFTLSKSDDAGGSEDAKSIAEAESLQIRLGVDIYNPSDVPRSFREICLEIKPKTKKASYIFPLYVFIENSKSVFMPYKKLEIINLPPKELKHFDFNSWPKKEEFIGLNGEVVVYFKALYPNGNKFKTRILTTELK
jgi:hypothetical protein